MPPPPVRFQCMQCEFSSATNRGLQSHTRTAHGYISEYALRIKTTRCEACNSAFRSRKMLLQHVRDS
eukprot:5597759-Amphidinium_carterae.1